MSLDPQSLINGYLDETLSPEEHAALQEWLQAAPENARHFAAASLLHDRLRTEFSVLNHIGDDDRDDLSLPLTMDSKSQADAAFQPSKTAPKVRSYRLVMMSLTTAMLLVVAVIWKGFGVTPAAAATTEINRIIAATTHAPDQTYHIAVEETGAISSRELGDDAPERQRPPKPPLTDATLHVRAGGQFVLIRQTNDGRRFTTGSNGRESWAIKPDGSVRVSSDLNEFNRDVPGHEHSMPLIHIEDGLGRLLEAYEVRLLPIETADDAAAESVIASSEATRLIVAVKKRQYRGPKRVEISYSVKSGLIQQMRFIEMPYGPERLTLRMTLQSQRPLGERFFEPTSHAEPSKAME